MSHKIQMVRVTGVEPARQGH